MFVSSLSYLVAEWFIFALSGNKKKNEEQRVLYIFASSIRLGIVSLFC